MISAISIPWWMPYLAGSMMFFVGWRLWGGCDPVEHRGGALIAVVGIAIVVFSPSMGYLP